MCQGNQPHPADTQAALNYPSLVTAQPTPSKPMLITVGGSVTPRSTAATTMRGAQSETLTSPLTPYASNAKKQVVLLRLRKSTTCSP